MSAACQREPVPPSRNIRWGAVLTCLYVLGGIADTTASLLVLDPGSTRVSLLDDAGGNTGSSRSNAAVLDLFHRGRASDRRRLVAGATDLAGAAGRRLRRRVPSSGRFRYERSTIGLHAAALQIRVAKSVALLSRPGTVHRCGDHSSNGHPFRKATQAIVHGWATNHFTGVSSLIIMSPYRLCVSTMV
jgi:hypothetical protein